MKSQFGICFILFFQIFIFEKLQSVQGSLDTDLTISSEQKQQLDKFRQLMQDRLPADYMKEDIYLIRWLRAKNFDLKGAERMLLQNLEWREKNRMDTILEEDFSDVSSEYVYHIDYYKNFKGQDGVISYVDFAQWDVRGAIIKGKRERGLRYLDRSMEEVTTLIRKLQSEGLNVTQYDHVVNMKGFNLITHACLQCLSGYPTFILSYEQHYPGACNKQFYVNTPSTFEVVLNSVKSVLSPRTRDTLEIYGNNKAEWLPKLLDHIPRDKLPIELGGTKVFND